MVLPTIRTNKNVAACFQTVPPSILLVPSVFYLAAQIKEYLIKNRASGPRDGYAKYVYIIVVVAIMLRSVGVYESEFDFWLRSDE